jgi:hypothetical protein
MAKVYYPKSKASKYLDGAIAGLVGGAVAILVGVLTDLLTPERSWWSSNSIIGSIFTGVQNFNTASPDMPSLLLGILLTLAAFALFGLGLPSYMPLFRHFRIHPALGGALYGLLLWLLVDLLVLNGLTGGRLNIWWLLVANLAAGAVMGLWLQWSSTRTARTPQPANTEVIQ